MLARRLGLFSFFSLYIPTFCHSAFWGYKVPAFQLRKQAMGSNCFAYLGHVRRHPALFPLEPNESTLGECLHSNVISTSLSRGSAIHLNEQLMQAPLLGIAVPWALTAEEHTFSRNVTADLCLNAFLIRNLCPFTVSSAHHPDSVYSVWHQYDKGLRQVILGERKINNKPKPN